MTQHKLNKVTMRKHIEHVSNMQASLYGNPRDHELSSDGGASIDLATGSAFRRMPDGTLLYLRGTGQGSTETPPLAGNVTAQALGEWLTSLSDAEQDLLFAMVVEALGSELSIEDRTRMEESLISVLVQHGIYDSVE